jgi:hypothetical protein
MLHNAIELSDTNEDRVRVDTLGWPSLSQGPGQACL